MDPSLEYSYSYILSSAPAQGTQVSLSDGPGNTTLNLLSSTISSGDTVQWLVPTSVQATYTGFTVGGDPIIYDEDSSAYFLLTNTDYSTDVTPEETSSFSCYCRGTRIQTEKGETAVEDLVIGDRVLTAGGALKPIRWIGHRIVRTHQGRYLFADPLVVNPIRLRAGALGENLPRRDLLLSPEHAILIGDILVQAGALVNGVSILREERMPEVLTYYHIELAEHALLLAEGVPAESFVDNVNRMSFDNGAEREALAGGAPSIAEMAYPRAQSHRQVPPAIHAVLIDRAQSLVSDLAA